MGLMKKFFNQTRKPEGKLGKRSIIRRCLLRKRRNTIMRKFPQADARCSRVMFLSLTSLRHLLSLLQRLRQYISGRDLKIVFPKLLIF